MRVLLLLLAVGLGLLFVVRWLEPRFAFFPSAGESTTPSEFDVPFTAVTLTTADGEQVRAWLLAATDARAFVVYFHGNGGNLSIWAPILSDLAVHGYDVLAVDYRGYGLSSGRPTESGVYRDADAVLEHLSTANTGSRPVIYWGRSLGTAVAAYAASRRRPDGIILEAGFPDARAVVRTSPLLAFLSIFSTYRFPTAERLAGIDTPVLVLHGDADRVIPFALGRALFDRLTGDKMFVAIPGGDHNDVKPANERVYWGAVDAFTRKIAAHRSS
jgi:pimeloyl-ACP methyl ester carboxylesterase